MQLTERGLEQAAAMSAWMSATYPWPSFVLSSSYARTLKTAAFIKAPANSLEVFDGLKERVFGFCQGYTDEEATSLYPGQWDAYKRLASSPTTIFDARPPGGESPRDVQQRLLPVCDRLQQLHEKHNDLTVAIVTHGVTIRALIMAICGYSPEWFYHNTIPGNCWVRELLVGKQVEDRGWVYAPEDTQKPERREK